MKKILIIEDNQIVANLYRNKFSTEGFQVEVALDGEAGLELVKAFRPDVIMLDLMLPKVSGVELMKQIRAEPDFAKVPVIVFSNTYLTNMMQEAEKAGATTCLSKANCTARQVLDVVRSAVGETAPPNAPAAVAVAATASPVAESAAPASERVATSDAEFQADLRKSFIESLPATLATLRVLLQGVVKAENEPARLKQVGELNRRIHALTGNAGTAGLLPISQFADALDALLKELHEKPRKINPSTLRTVATAVDFLGHLFEHGIAPGRQAVPAAKILVVDDDVISRRALTRALEKARLESVSVDDANAAGKLLSENHYDLVLLDVDMPGMNGFELCTKLRAMPMHANTAVVFVTNLSDFESRASSMMSGGNDLIAKPFLFIELAVKALIYVLRAKLAPAAKPAP